MQVVAIAFAAGAVLSLQALINARLGAALGSPLWASTVSLIGGALGLIVVQTVTRATLPNAGQIIGLPLWAWCGGLLGAFYLVGVLVGVGRPGVATTIGLVVFGQMAASLALDHFGVLMPPPHLLTPTRLLGAGLHPTGVVLIKST